MAKQDMKASLATLEKITQDNAALVSGAANTLTQAVAYASAVQQVMDVLSTDVMATVFMPLRNKGRLGWRTDKEYTVEQLRDVWTDALLRGVLPINDELCVIGANTYIQKNYFKRKLRTYPKLTDLKLQPGKVDMKPSGALVEMTLTCLIDGKAHTLSRVGDSAIPVRLNSGQGADAGLGKAERKIMAQFWAQLTGSEMTDAECGVEDIEATPTNGRVVEDEPEKKSTQAAKTAEVLKKTREGKADTAAAGGAVPWEDTPKTEPTEQPKTTTKTVGFVKDGATGTVTKVTREVPVETPKVEEAPAAPAAETTQDAPAVGEQEVETNIESESPQKKVTGVITRITKNTPGPGQKTIYSLRLNGDDKIKYDTVEDAQVKYAVAQRDAKGPVCILYAEVNGVNEIATFVDESSGEVKA